jgi:hypothetical protein
MSYSGVRLELYSLNEDGTYGGLYQFRPSPILDINREVFRTNDGTTIGGGFNLTLNGSLLPATIGGTGSGMAPPGHDYADGSTSVWKTFEAKDALAAAVNRDLTTLKGTFVPFVGTGGPTDTGCPEVVGIYANNLTIQSIDFSSPDQWTQRVDYTIEMFCPNSISIGASTSGTEYSGGSEYTFGSDVVNGTLQSKDIEYSVSVYDKGSVTSLTGGGVEKTSVWFQVQVQQNLQTMLGFGAQQGASSEAAAGIDRAVNAFLNLGQASGGGAISGQPDFGILQYDTNAVSGQTDGSGISGVGTTAVLVDRNIGLNIAGGNTSVTDTYIGTALAGPTGYTSSGITTGLYIDKYDVNLEGSRESAIVTVTVDGEIEGLERYDEGGVGIARAKEGLGASAFSGSGGAPATGASGRTISATVFYNRALEIYSDIPAYSSTLLDLQVEPISQSVGYNISEATVTYSFTYSNRPTPCNEQALSENISLTKSKAVPVTASHVILGRTNGPLFQDIGTKTASTTDLTVEAFLVPLYTAQACTGNLSEGAPQTFYDQFVASVQQGIEDTYETYYITSDSETYDPIAGRYTRNISWVHTDC